MYKIAKKLDSINIKGIDCHTGSQITELKPFEDSIKKLMELINHLKSIDIFIKHIDIGGGIGIKYSKEEPPTFSDYAKTVKNILQDTDLKIIFEPGRALIGKSGVLLTEVEFIKNGPEKNFVIVNAAMNDLMRPTLYDAFHEITSFWQGLQATFRFGHPSSVSDTFSVSVLTTPQRCRNPGGALTIFYITHIFQMADQMGRASPRGWSH